MKRIASLVAVAGGMFSWSVALAQGGPNDRALAEDETRGFVKLVCAGRKERIVGAHLVAPRAGELIHHIAQAMRHRLSAAALGGLIHAYPTFTQVTQQAGVEAVLARLGRPWVQKVLAHYLAWWRRF